jgi:hypothetical protein
VIGTFATRSSSPPIDPASSIDSDLHKRNRSAGEQSNNEPLSTAGLISVPLETEYTKSDPSASKFSFVGPKVQPYICRLNDNSTKWFLYRVPVGTSSLPPIITHQKLTIHLIKYLAK